MGRKIEERLIEQGIETVAALRHMDAAAARQGYSVALERTVRELRGTACLDLEDHTANKQQIICSRSFGVPVYSVNELAESIRAYMTRAAEKLRRQGSIAGVVGVWIETNRFRPQDAQHQPSATVTLPAATGDKLRLSRWPRGCYIVSIGKGTVMSKPAFYRRTCASEVFDRVVCSTPNPSETRSAID